MKVDAEAAGLDPVRLDRIGEHLRSSYVDAGKIAGCQVAVQRHGALGYFESFGMADRERSTPIAEDTIFRLYSMSKPVTGVALLTLYERGLFQLDDPVHRFIPEWRGLQVKVPTEDGGEALVDPVRPPSVRDAMMHMSGIGYAAENADLVVDGIGSGRFVGPETTLETLGQQIAQWPLRFHPGTHWLYSFGTDVCARIVEVLSGQRFDDYLRTEIFEPLGMVDTAFSVDDARAGRLAACYARNSRKELVLIDDPATSAYRRQPAFLSGGGGLLGTTADYLRFTQMLTNGGELDGRRILGRKTVELMGSNHLPGGATLAEFTQPGTYGEVGMDGMGFGLTMSVAQEPARTGVVGSVGEFMWGGAASTIFWVDPVEDLSVVFMTQLLPSGTFNFRGQLKSIIYGALAD